VAFHITISYVVYSHTRRQQSRDADGGHTNIYWSDGSDVRSANKNKTLYKKTERI